MQKKGITKIAPVQPRHMGGCITAQKVTIRKRDILIIDLFADKKYIHRIAFEGTDYSSYPCEHSGKENKYEWESLTSLSNVFAEKSGYDDAAKKYRSGRYDDWSKDRGVRVDHESRKAMSEFFGVKTDRNMLKYINSRMYDFRAKKEKDRADARKAEMDMHFEGIPDVPEYFTEELEAIKHLNNVIYYKRTKNYAKYHCCNCGEEYQLRTADYDDLFIADKVFPVPQRGKVFECPCCKTDGLLEWMNRKTFKMYEEYRYLIQCNDAGEIVIRQFCTSGTRSNSGGHAISARDSVTELSRCFLKPKKSKMYYNWKGRYTYGSYQRQDGTWGYKETYHRNDEWTTRSLPTRNQSLWYDGRCTVAPGAIENSLMKYCDLDSYKLTYTEFYDTMFAVRCLKAFSQFPEMEMLQKVGLSKTAAEAVRQSSKPYGLHHGKDLATVLAIRKRDVKEVIKEAANGNEYYALRFYQSIKAHDIPENEYGFWKQVCSNEDGKIDSSLDYGVKGDLDVVLKYHRSRGKCIKYIQSQADKYHLTFRDQLREYRDYINLRVRLGFDMNNSVFIIPNDLRRTYEELREQERALTAQKDIKLAEDRFSDIPKQFKKLCKVYGCEVDDYIIRPAQTASEIIKEGSTLHHCVGSLNQRYLGEHNEGKSFILFMRFKNEPTVPYITIQIVGADIKQWYGAYDKKPEQEKIDKILAEYQEALRKNVKLMKSA